MNQALHARTFASVHRHRNYRLFFTGQIVSVSGTWMQNIALAWLVVQLTDSPLAVGLLAFCRFFPFTLLGLFAGTIADRIDNRRALMGTQAIQMLLAATLATIALGGWATVWQVYAIAALGGAVLVLDAPLRQGLTFQMVGRDELPNAVALNSSVFNASRIIGPALAGALIAGAGVGTCFALNALSFLAVLGGLWLMRPEELHRLERREPTTILRATREGLGYVRRSPRVALVLGLVLVVSTVGFNFNVILPLLASDTLAAGPKTFGIITACFGAGALGGALLSATIARSSWKVLLLGTGGFALTELLLAPERSLVAVGGLLFLTGACFTLWTSNSNTLLQLGAPDYLRGRVIGLYYYAFNGIAPLGGLLAGWLCARGGTQLALAVAGLSGLTITVGTYARLRYEARMNASSASTTSGSNCEPELATSSALAASSDSARR